jgi:hypothetical protein
MVPSKRATPKIQGPIGELCKCLTGGRKTFMELAHLAPHIEPGLARFVEAWDALTPTMQQTVDLDRLCLDKELDPNHVMSVVGEAAAKFRENTAIIMASLAMPEIIKKGAKVALTTDGWRDRKFFYEHSRFIPVSQGTRIGIINKQTNTAEVNSVETTAGAGRGLPSHEETVGAADDALQEEGL